jgi:hypothetical protein
MLILTFQKSRFTRGLGRGFGPLGRGREIHSISISVNVDESVCTDASAFVESMKPSAQQSQTEANLKAFKNIPMPMTQTLVELAFHCLQQAIAR